MYDYIIGHITEITPTYTVIQEGGIGYFIQISLNTYTQVQEVNHCKLWLHQIVREDAHQLYGFSSKDERAVFRDLISVSGIGANTARMMLSSLKPDEIRTYIQTGSVENLKSVKGIGAKSAQRIIVDLKDKIGGDDKIAEVITTTNNTIKNEALSALVMLGFSKKPSEKVVIKILQEDPEIKVEDLVKKALKTL
jgi:Holliday junction DNA helicase RuvA